MLDLLDVSLDSLGSAHSSRCSLVFAIRLHHACFVTDCGLTFGLYTRLVASLLSFGNYNRKAIPLHRSCKSSSSFNHSVLNVKLRFRNTTMTHFI